MKISKQVNGHYVELIIDKIKDYVDERVKYATYQVSRMVNGKKEPLYTECFSDFDIKRIIKDGCRIYEYDRRDDGLYL